MSQRSPYVHARHGSVLVLTVFCLTLCLMFAAFSVDIGRISLTKSNMQASVDAAALAAAQELTNAVYQSGEGGTTPAQSIAAAMSGARSVATTVASKNGTYVDPQVDVKFGQRTINGQGDYSIDWSASPPNVVRVTARRTEENTDAPDGSFRLLFAKAAGIADSADILAHATAYVEARDLVLVLDYSGSMNDDSDFKAMANSRLGKTAVEENLDEIWDTLVAANLSFSNSSQFKFPSGGYGRIDSYRGTYISSNNDQNVFNALNLAGVPWPQEGKFVSGMLRGTPPSWISEARWKAYIKWVRTDHTVNSHGYRKRYGYRTLMAYLGKKRPYNHSSEDLWRAPYYPFHAMKEGVSLLTNFLADLDFGDNTGLVVYATASKKEHALDYPSEPDVPVVDLGNDWITDDFEAIDAIQRHKQAAHYSKSTAIGYGIKDAREMLNDHKRFGARPTILVMTDGNANRYPANFRLSSYWPGWSWDDLTDFDDDGVADYSTNDRAKQYAFYEARKCLDAGFLIHTMSVGSEADEELMEAIARSSGGIYYRVPSGTSFEEFRDDMKVAFSRIAANVPPAKLLISEDLSN